MDKNVNEEGGFISVVASLSGFTVIVSDDEGTARATLSMEEMKGFAEDTQKVIALLEGVESARKVANEKAEAQTESSQ